MKSRRSFRGLSAFPITPMDAGGRVLAEDLARLLERLAAASVDSIGFLGSTGSYMYLSRGERRRAVEIAAEVLRGRVPLIASVGAMRTDEAQALARDAEAAGADGLLLAPVSYTPLRDEEVFRHYEAVAGCTGLPLCIYNNPSTTHFTFSNELIARLARVPGIVAVKNTGLPAADMPAAHSALRALVPADFALGYSGDWNAGGAVLAGGIAWYSVIGGLLPEPSLKLMRAAEAGDAAEVARLNGLFEPLWALFRELSSYRVVHAGAKALGLTRADPPLPILPLSAADEARAMGAIEAVRTI
ncbi:dihydrodipicolinate synthase family protein [Enterovirga aerilata]|uniref:Dihydrodipicolinate synthase family protein n=1 Tax=Enterovirga aerilata TaxID=2730920 RepID=A0A849HZJ4_9HYPH|nr:dihydrodipicolinate synthase family protein [Enterovirga sp. DB1703]NNM72512.1 dihydrodipicolinate synthase family protein [Enterovirga sp. DB1703]